MALIYFNS